MLSSRTVGKQLGTFPTQLCSSPKIFCPLLFRYVGRVGSTICFWWRLTRGCAKMFTSTETLWINASWFNCRARHFDCMAGRSIISAQHPPKTWETKAPKNLADNPCQKKTNLLRDVRLSAEMLRCACSSFPEGQPGFWTAAPCRQQQELGLPGEQAFAKANKSSSCQNWE